MNSPQKNTEEPFDKINPRTRSWAGTSYTHKHINPMIDIFIKSNKRKHQETIDDTIDETDSVRVDDR